MAIFSFKSKIFIQGTITALTGLHIGGSSTEMSIGGADSIVVRDPLTNYPYIPGSSLRGKMRSLLERSRGEMTIQMENKTGDKIEPITCSDLEQAAKYLNQGCRLKSAGPATDFTSKAAQLFGVAVDQVKSTEKIVPQRLVVRDAMLDETSAQELAQSRYTDMPFTEVKTEVVIDRITSKAMPRQIERVPAGAKFNFEFVLNLYGNDEQKEYLSLLWECMQLLEDDYLGGNGSRGYGRIKFAVKSLLQKTKEDYQQNKQPRPLETEIPDIFKPQGA